MPLDPTKVALAVESGVSVVCATCTHFWVAADNLLDDCGQACGGPMSGGVFEKYQGPVIDFSVICFVCGEPSTNAVRAVGNVRVLGCCDAHVDTVKSWKPVDKPPVNIILNGKTGTQATDEVPVPRPRVSLRIV